MEPYSKFIFYFSSLQDFFGNHVLKADAVNSWNLFWNIENFS